MFFVVPFNDERLRDERSMDESLKEGDRVRDKVCLKGVTGNVW